MRVFVRALVSLLLLVSFPMSAAIQYKDYADTSCAGDMNTDHCFGDPATTYGGDYSVCSARASENQGCWAVVQIPRTDGTYERKCAKIQQQGGCSCDSSTLRAKGSCAYYTR